MAKGLGDKPEVSVQVGPDTKKYSPEEISAMVHIFKILILNYIQSHLLSLIILAIRY